MRHPEELVPELLERVPELGDALSDLLKEWHAVAAQAPNSDYIISAGVAPFAISLATNLTPSRQETLRRLFAFLDELKADPNEGVHSLVDVSFVEQFVTNRAAVRSAWHLIGPRVQRSFEPLLESAPPNSP